jgi:hypothetical protein
VELEAITAMKMNREVDMQKELNIAEKDT